MQQRVVARWIFGVALVAALIALDTRAATSADGQSTDPGPDRAATSEPTLSTAKPLPFRTRYAYFRPADFAELPGWDSDHLAQGWSAFRQSCNVLSRRSAWSGPCARSANVDGSDDRKVRAFLESEFVLFQISDLQLAPTGVVTGYYEPLLYGRRVRGGNFVYPVYATPDDLLLLDSRAIPANRRSFEAIVEGKSIVPVARESSSDTRPRYRVEIGSAVADVRDKRIRMRIDGERIVPYYTRSEIDERGLASAHVLAWVDDPAMLYAMHVQGAGRIRFEDGSVLRLAYGEQNGHPFLPPQQAAGDKGAGVVRAPLARGLVLEADASDASSGEASSASTSEPGVLTRGIAPPAGTRADAAKNSSRPSSADPSTDAVERMADLLMGEAPPPSSSDRTATASATPPAKSERDTAAKSDRETAGKSAGSESGGRPVASATKPSANAANPSTGNATAANAKAPVAMTASNTDASRLDAGTNVPVNTSPGRDNAATAAWYARDPSYVFFRALPNYDGGPVGALGVPLTPQRSVAVDPRTTPLGSPVFIAAEGGSLGRWSRLLFAQDTGGAIRGPVRADFFWGFGSEAARRAGQMKQSGQMWLLLPKGQAINGVAEGIAGRGVGGAPASDAECVVPDPDFCVE